MLCWVIYFAHSACCRKTTEGKRRGEGGGGGVQSVHVGSVREDYIQRAPSGGLSVDTLVREVTVLERDHNPKYDEKENGTLKKCRYSSQSGGRFSKGDQFVSVSELCTCVTAGCTTSPFDVKLQDWTVTASSSGVIWQRNVPGWRDAIWKVTSYMGCRVMSLISWRAPHASFSLFQVHPTRRSAQNRSKNVFSL